MADPVPDPVPDPIPPAPSAPPVPDPTPAPDISAMLDEMTSKVEAARAKIQSQAAELAALKQANAALAAKFRAALDSLTAALA